MADAQPLLRTADEILDAVKARKEALGLSDALVDEIAGYSAGRWNKSFGPSCEKPPSVSTLMIFADVLGLSIMLVEDPQKVRRMSSRWQRRAEGYVHDASKVASSAMRRLRPPACQSEVSDGPSLMRRGAITRDRLNERMQLALKGAGPSKAELRATAAAALANSTLPVTRLPAPRRRKPRS
jgi:hypothetical protein